MGNEQYPSTAACCDAAIVTVRWLGFHRIWQGSGEVFDSIDLFLPDVQFGTQVCPLFSHYHCCCYHKCKLVWIRSQLGVYSGNQFLRLVYFEVSLCLACASLHLLYLTACSVYTWCLPVLSAGLEGTKL